MFDDLREPDKKDDQSFQDALGFGTAASAGTPPSARPRPVQGFLGLTASQRLVLALLLLLAVCVLGMMCLLMTGRISAF